MKSLGLIEAVGLGGNMSPEDRAAASAALFQLLSSYDAMLAAWWRNDGQANKDIADAASRARAKANNIYGGY